MLLISAESSNNKDDNENGSDKKFTLITFNRLRSIYEFVIQTRVFEWKITNL